MKILTFSSLFPNERQPSHGIFVENRLRQLRLFEPSLEVKVVAPVPWFPFKHSLFGDYATFAAIPDSEMRHGIEVLHPRYPVIPKIGMRLTPRSMYRAVRQCVAEMVEKGFDFDLIDAHYFYPDGVAAMHLAKRFKRPLVVTGRGSDLNLIPRFRAARSQIRETAREAGHLITVAAALKDYLVELGVDEEHISVLRNGVDLEFFRPAPERATLRSSLGWEGSRVLLSVGQLIERKGHELVIHAMQALPDHRLVVIGEGPLDGALKRQVDAAGLGDRVRFTGRLDQPMLRTHYQAADVLVLASSREGWANVLLESMACGTPVVATAVDGTPEVVAEPAAGVLLEQRNAKAIAQAVIALDGRAIDRTQTRRYAERFGWHETSRGQVQVFRRLLADEADSQQQPRPS